MSEKKYIKFLDYSSFEYDTFTLPKKNYPFFNIDDSNVDKVDIILIDENDNRYNSYIRYTDKSRENSPTRLLKWNKDFTSYLKKKIPNWIEIKKGEKSENFKLIFEPTEDKSIFKIFVKSSNSLVEDKSKRYFQKFIVGNFYSRKTISDLIMVDGNEPNFLDNREGLYYCKNSETTILFCDLNKDKKEKDFKYNDYFESNYFHWDSNNRQHFDVPTIQNIVKKEVEVLLFSRIEKTVNNKTQPYIYCGRLEYHKHEENTKNPIHIIFDNIDFDDDLTLTNENYRNIIKWTSKNKSSEIDLSGEISNKRKNNYKKPSKTERKGMTTSRVGQGWYRTEVLRKWDYKCSVTGCDIQKILISSHIVPWRDSNDEERLDVDNGLLLSPDLDGLFDKNLISFNDDGSILVSDKISSTKLYYDLGINIRMKLRFVNEGMKKYLKRHREKLLQ